MGRRVSRTLQIVSRKDVLDPNARVYSSDVSMTNIKFELRRRMDDPCHVCNPGDLVVREVTLRIKKVRLEKETDQAL